MWFNTCTKKTIVKKRRNIYIFLLWLLGNSPRRNFGKTMNIVEGFEYRDEVSFGTNRMVDAAPFVSLKEECVVISWILYGWEVLVNILNELRVWFKNKSSSWSS